MSTGHRLGRPLEGPAPELVESGFHLENADAPLLHAGKNTLAATVWHFGTHAAIAQMSERTGFLLHGAGAAESIVCFRPGVGIGLEEIDGPVEAHSLAACWTSTGICDGLWLDTGYIPFQTREINLQCMADAERRDAAGEFLEIGTSVLQILLLRQDLLHLQLMGQLGLQITL